MLLFIEAGIWSTVWEFCLIPLFGLLIGFISTWIDAKRKEALAKTDNEIVKKYINIAADVINTAVIATTETYVKSMKNQNLFDKEAQKTALQMTKDTVIATLSEEAKAKLSNVYGDLNKFIEAKIEEAVKNTK